MEFDEEQDKGFKIKVNAPPAIKNKPTAQNNKHDDDFIEDDIEEEIESQRDDPKNTLGESSGRGFGITVSQSLGIDKSVDSLALDEYDHIEYVE